MITTRFSNKVIFGMGKQVAQSNRLRLLIGNGPNRVVLGKDKNTWDSLLDSLVAVCQPYSGLAWDACHTLAFSHKMTLLGKVEAVCREMGQNAVERAKKNWLKRLARLKPTPVYSLLKPVFDAVGAIYTTNYDLVLELVTKKPVCHMHGSAREPDGVVLYTSDYTRLLDQAMKSEVPWVNELCEYEWHICGLSLQPEEIVLWYALQQRMEKILKLHRGEPMLPSVVFYNFYEDSESGRASARRDADLCRAYRLVHEPVIVPQGNYFLAWEVLVGRLMGRLRRFPHDNVQALRLLGKGCSSKYHAGQGMNVNILQTPDSQFPQFALLNVKEAIASSADLLGAEEAITDWYFLCALPYEEVRLFSCSVSEFRRRWRGCEEALIRWTDGCIYFRKANQSQFSFKAPLKCRAVSPAQFKLGVQAVHLDAACKPSCRNTRSHS